MNFNVFPLNDTIHGSAVLARQKILCSCTTGPSQAQASRCTQTLSESYPRPWFCSSRGKTLMLLRQCDTKSVHFFSEYVIDVKVSHQRSDRLAVDVRQRYR